MNKTFATVGLLGVLALTGCATHTQTAPSQPAPPVIAPPPTTGNVPPVTTTPPPAPRQAVIYTVDTTHGTDANNYLVPQTIALTDTRAPAREALQALIASPESPLPRGTRLRSVHIRDGLATVDFSRSPVDEIGGEEAQAQALEALQRTLGQFPNVSSLQITVHGKPLPAIGEAAGGPVDVIRPGDPLPESGGA